MTALHARLYGPPRGAAPCAPAAPSAAAAVLPACEVRSTPLRASALPHAGGGEQGAWHGPLPDRAVYAARAAARVRKLAAGVSRNSAEAVAGVHGSQDVQSAMAEWREATAAANAADSEEGDRGGGGRQGQRRRQQRRRM